jgi:hypothetical protein
MGLYNYYAPLTKHIPIISFNETWNSETLDAKLH